MSESSQTAEPGVTSNDPEPIVESAAAAKAMWPKRLIVLAVFLGVILWLQAMSGTYHSEFGSHPDEAAHYVTGLMVRDYLTTGIPKNPMRFAEAYYDHYPKVALGHYPPVFYVFEAVWSLVFSGSRTSILVFMALQSLALSAMVFLSLERYAGFWLGVAGGAFCALAPLTQQYDSMVMADAMLAVFCFLSGLAFVRYIVANRPVDSLLFGVFASAAILTKGSALFLAAVPLAALILCGRLDLLKRWSFWIPAPVVAILCGPWMALTYKIAGDGWTGDTIPVFFQKAVPYFAAGWVHIIGVALILPALVGILSNRLFRWAKPEPGLAAFTAVMTAIPLCLTAFSSLVPAGLELRYLLPGLPCVVALAILGIAAIVRVFPDLSSSRRVRLQWALVAACAIGFLGVTFQIPRKSFTGFREVAEELERSQPKEPCEIIVSSDARGEGALVSELAMNGRKPAWTVRRASKLLAASDWMGRGYTLLFENEEKLSDYLQKAAISWIVIDESIPSDLRAEHHKLLENTLLKNPEKYRLIKSFSVIRGDASSASGVRLYHKEPRS